MIRSNLNGSWSSMIPKTCRLFGQDHSTNCLERFRSSTLAPAAAKSPPGSILAGRFAQTFGVVREVLDVDARQRTGEGVLGLAERRNHHLVEQDRFDDIYAVDLVGRAGGAQDVVGGNSPTLAGELIATARPADALRMPWRTRACRTGSRCRGGRLWREAKALAATGRPRALRAMSMTAAMAKMPLRGRSGMGVYKVEGGRSLVS